MWEEITHDMTAKEKWAVVGYGITALIACASFYVTIWAIITLGE